MADCLKANPYITRDEYMWEWTIPQLRLISFDFTHVNYLTDEEFEKKNAKRVTSDELVSEFGIPTL